MQSANVNLEDDPVLKRALEHWHPKYLEWWRDTGPSGFSEDLIYLRTAVGVGKGGRMHVGYIACARSSLAQLVA